MVVPVWKSVGDQLIWKAESDVWIARTGTWQPESPHGSRMGYLPWLKSCWLLQLNHGAWGEDLTSQLSWVAAWLLVTGVCPVCLVDELALLTFFLHGEWFYFYGRILLFYGVGMEFKGKIMLHCFREVKCQQGFTPGISY